LSGRKKESNPVNPAIGNKFETETDYVGGGTFPLRFVRHYNSLGGGEANESARLGRNWTHTYSRRLLFNVGGLLNVVTAVREDGRVVAFNRASVNDPYLNEQTSNETLLKTVDGWQLVALNDDIELYDNAGRLTSGR